MVVGLRNAIESFPTSKPIATVEEIMSFVEPYAPWKVKAD
jgi:hypothetical protein